MLFFIFLTGSSIINIPGPLIVAAKNYAWMSILLSWLGGCLLLGGLIYLHRRFPDKDLVGISTALIGKAATIIIGVLFLLPFMLHMGTGIMLDVGLFMESAMMSETPIYIFTATLMIVSVLTVMAGVEVFSQMFTLLSVMLVIFVVIVLVLSIPDYDISYLKPIFPQNVKPVLFGAYMSFTFPYAEVVLFSMLIPFVRQQERARIPKVMYIAMTANLVLLILVTVSTILLFGPIAGDRKFPMFEMARTIEVLDIVQRIESVIGMSLIVGSYMKVTITLFVMYRLLVRLFNISDSNLIVPCLGLICVLNGQATYTGMRKWMETVGALGSMWSPFALVLPVVILIVVSTFRRIPAILRGNPMK